VSSDELIDEDEFARDERLPYWADLWPSSRVLGRHLIDRADPPRYVLELGCGSGLVATAAAAAGHTVTATDYEENALAFTRVNVARNSGVDVATRLVDWRVLPDDLGAFDLVVASDVLYERAYADPMAHAVDATLAPGGVAIIADPGRVARDIFVEAAKRRGLDVDDSLVVPHPIGDITQHITLLTLTR
jgi:predicted nicotinamide N-methyase